MKLGQNRILKLYVVHDTVLGALTFFHIFSLMSKSIVK